MATVEGMECQYQVMTNLLDMSTRALDDLLQVYERLWDDDMDAARYTPVFETAALYCLCEVHAILLGYQEYVDNPEIPETHADAAFQWKRRAEVIQQGVHHMSNREGLERIAFAALCQKTVKIWKDQPLLIDDWKAGMEEVLEFEELDAFTDETE